MLPEKEIAKCFVSGLKPDIFREEMYSRTFENLDNVVREARDINAEFKIFNILNVG